jgi:hypothetical protein
MTKTTGSRPTWLRSGAAAPWSHGLASWGGLWLCAGIFGSCAGNPSAPPGTAAQDAAAAAPPPAAADPSSSSTRSTEQTQTTLAFMHGHYDDSVRMRQAIVAGKLDEFQRVAARVADDDWSPRLRPGYVPFVSSMRDVASHARSAASLTSAAADLGKLGDSCAACHLKLGGPEGPIAPTPVAENTEETMLSHSLATDLLWAGLIRPSDSSWALGANVLSETPSLDSDVGEVGAAAEYLHALARQAIAAEPTERRKLFSSIIVTCSACHERLGLQISAPAPAH